MINDPYLWLEDVDSEEALAWVKTRSQESLAYFTSRPSFQETYQDILSIYDSDNLIPFVYQVSGYFYTFKIPDV